ncbi:hypothetical protein GCM10009584_10840 [Ornithinimicrobium humiphilum]|uniref:Uncharacterized protein n=1 Tax=Ornithinimicrobium humiphilum TaxID=125288 RepID=A0A543KJD9_9MICO|nr:DUF6049 family protein [Ornithinimicrobium humiphilum]TQM95192.1 hypothetical protein FB476_0025 [Ornithinimicrobium humiphilum]
MHRSARRSAWAVRPRAAAATVALAGLLLSVLPGLPAPAVATPAPASVAEEQDDEEQDAPGVRVVLDQVVPAVARVGEPLTLRGRIVNDGDQRHRLGLVTVRAAWSPLVNRADVTHWLEGRDERDAGWFLGQDDVGPVVVPGASVPFSVTVPETGLDALPGDLAVLALEIVATGEAEPGSTGPVPEPVSLRTVVTAARTDRVATPLDTAWVVPLTLPADPDLTSRDDTDRHRAWAAATGPGSPLRTWLEDLTLPSVTWLVDPSVLVPVDPADDLAEEDPEEAPGTGGDGTDAPGTTSEPSPTGREDSDDPAVTSAPGEEEDGGDPGPDRNAASDDADGTPGGEDGSEEDGSPDVDEAGATATAAPDEATSTASPGGLEEGQDLGSRPDDPEEPVTAADVTSGLVALRGLLARADEDQLWWTPVGDPDVAALLEDGQSPATARGVLDLPMADTPVTVERLLRRGRSDVAWPVLAAPGADQVIGLDRYWATRTATPEGLAGIVVPRESLTGGSNAVVGTAARPLQGVDGIVALGVDTRASSLLAGAREDSARSGAGAVTQRLLADSLTAYQQDPDAVRSMLYVPPRATDVPSDVLTALSEGLGEAPWIRTVAAGDLLTAAQATPPVALTGVAPEPSVLGSTITGRVEPGASPLDAASQRRLARLGSSLAGLTEILEDGSAVRSWETLLAHLWSARWRGSQDAWGQAWQGARRPAVQAQRAVHVNPSTVNFLSEQGIVQVTVVNDLPVAVEGVRVELVPDHNILRVIQQPDPVTIGPRSRATVSFTAQAVTRGVTTVNARLTTPNGTTLGDDARVSVRVQPTGVWIYWVLGSLAGLVLVLGLVRARRTAPRSAVVAASGGPDPSSTPTPEENR